MVDDPAEAAHLGSAAIGDEAVACRYYGREYTVGQMRLIGELIATERNRSAIARVFCERTDWRKPDGGLKSMMAKVAMLAMHRDGVITLPPPARRPPVVKPIVPGPASDPPVGFAPTSLTALCPLDIRIVVGGAAEGRLWNEYVARYHYLGYTRLVGAQMRYAVHDRAGHPLAMLGFSTAAWRLAPRDAFIGWSSEQRERNLPRVIDNPRFLILPWVRVPNLGSHVLSLIRRRLPDDWTARYGLTPVLCETFVEVPRHTGGVYRASGWVHVGQTKGRGRYDRHKKADKPKKDIWLQSLRKDWKRILNR